MHYTSLIMMALIWGALLIFFLVPFSKSKDPGILDNMNFTEALKHSFVMITFHKKAILAFLLIAITLFITLWTVNQNVYYNEIHAIKPQPSSFKFPLGVLVYSAAVYIVLIISRAIKLSSENN